MDFLLDFLLIVVYVWVYVCRKGGVIGDMGLREQLLGCFNGGVNTLD